MTRMNLFSIFSALTLTLVAAPSFAATCTVVNLYGHTTSYFNPGPGDEIEIDLDHLERLGPILRFDVPAPLHPFVKPFIPLAPGIFQRDRRPTYAAARWFSTVPGNPRSPLWNEFVEYGNGAGDIRSILAVKENGEDGRASTLFQLILDCR